MESLYWILECAKTFVSFYLILLVWPRIVFRKHLADKGRTYRFAFCVTVQPVLITTVVIILGLLHILHPVVIAILFYGTFIFSLLYKSGLNKEKFFRIKNFFSGTYGAKSALSDIGGVIKSAVVSVKNSFLEFMSGHWFEYTLLILVVLFGMIYFTIGMFENETYGFGDLYVHHAWTYNLTVGNIFSGGIYPEGMHCFICCQNVLFGVDIQSLFLFNAGAQSAIILVSIYVFLRQIFRWRYSATVVLFLFLIVDVKCVLAATSFSRLQWTIPQEWGFPGMFLVAAFLIRFLREKLKSVETVKLKKATKNEYAAKSDEAVKKDGATESNEAVKNEKTEKTEDTIKTDKTEINDKSKKNSNTKKSKKIRKARLPLCLRNQNLFIFMMALTSTLTAHFYATMMAFFICVGVVVFSAKQIFSKKFISLAVSCMLALTIACVPMALGFATGIPLEGSLGWAVSLFSPKDEKTDEHTRTNEPANEADGAEGEKTGNNSEIEAGGLAGRETGKNSEIEADGLAIKNTGKLLESESYEGIICEAIPNSAGTEISERTKTKLDTLYSNGYMVLYGERRTALLMVASVLGILLWISYRIVYRFRKKSYIFTELESNSFDGHGMVVFLSVLFTVLYAAESMGLINIIEQYRVGTPSQLMMLSVIFAPVDYIGVFVLEPLADNIKKIVTASMVIAAYIFVRVTGNFHGYLMIELTRYNSSVNVAQSIIQDMEDDNFTVVSTTDELYQMMGHGFHEELISFVNQSEIVSYTLPTEYIFLMLEKKPLSRAQHHLFTGPSWLAEDRYCELYGEGTSRYPDAIHMDIEPEMSDVYFGPFPYSSTVYNTLWKRVALMSKAYVWCQKFNDMYPNELHIYYEDDDIICYYLKQNPRQPYELAVMDPDAMILPNEYPNPIWPEKEYE